MSLTFKLLKCNDPEVLRYYAEANKIWEQLLEDYKGDSIKLAHQLEIKQLKFEYIVQDNGKYSRWDGQEIMVFSGLSYFLDDESERGFKLAASIAEAFEISYCSLEIKSLAKRVSKLFYLVA
ncbi:hypothetical protein [Acinetobacter piscicola]|uniref:hypothetical protein n=1 Tax=Acinetobacter piscicola TaxID=2006115 RepID=UPI000B7EAC0C|nr:hypothetical protein [Acinetobacter piscicola]